MKNPHMYFDISIMSTAICFDIFLTKTYVSHNRTVPPFWNSVSLILKFCGGIGTFLLCTFPGYIFWIMKKMNWNSLVLSKEYTKVFCHLRWPVDQSLNLSALPKTAASLCSLFSWCTFFSETLHRKTKWTKGATRRWSFSFSRIFRSNSAKWNDMVYVKSNALSPISTKKLTSWLQNLLHQQRIMTEKIECDLYPYFEKMAAPQVFPQKRFVNGP